MGDSGRDFADLLRAAREGDSEAFGDLVAPILRLGVSLSFSILGDIADGEDAVQEALVRLARKLPEFGDPSELRRYFCRLIINESKRVRAKRWLFGQRRVSFAAETPAPAVSPERRAESREVFEFVLREIPRLPRREREVFVLRALEDLEYPEIADLLGVKPVTARRFYSLARTRIETSLAGRGLRIDFPD